MRGMRYVMAFCVMVLVCVGCDQKTTVLVGSLTGPSGVVPQCSDGVDNADPEDTLADADDPGCRRPDGSYDPNDNDETNGPSGPSGIAAPGAFNLHGSCTATGRAKLVWDVSARAERYAVIHWTWTTRQGLATVLELRETNVELQADTSADNYWQVVAFNSAGQTTSASPDERDDKTATFACGKPAAACSDKIDNDRDGKTDASDPGCSYPQGFYDPNDPDETDGPSASGTPGTPGTPGTTTPPSGGACSGMSWSASKTTGHVGETFTVSINSGGCQVVLESDHTDNVSVNNQNGRFVALGSANVCLRSIAGLAPSICQTMTTQ